LNYRLKLLLFFLCALGVFFLLNTGYSTINTISRLDIVEAERDQWQRPAEVVQALGLRPGDVVVDLGCGSGYFALKLSAPVGKKGRVLAEDIRRLPLAFLWFRAILKGERNITVLHGEPSDPHLPPQHVNEVLIANTFHELTDPQAILTHVRQALVHGGGLVVLDRSPKLSTDGAPPLAEHQISAELVDSELRQAGFEILRRLDDFIGRDQENEGWWLIAARRP
jgi:ubiquinone/menaquinone biosynthesis C-methylase UbiE